MHTRKVNWHNIDIGETVTINDKAWGGKLIAKTKMTLLYVGGSYPDQLLTIVIPGAAIKKFNRMLAIDYKGMNIIVTGKLLRHKGTAKIVVFNPSELRISALDPVDTI